MEAQACGLPALVSNEGGPKEIVDDGVDAAWSCPATTRDRWCDAIDELLDDEPRRQRMAARPPQRDAPVLAGADVRGLLGRARARGRKPPQRARTDAASAASPAVPRSGSVTAA